MFRLRTLLVAGTLALSGMLGGCVYSPGYGPGYGYYGGSVVAYGDGWHHGGWHHDHDWYR